MPKILSPCFVGKEEESSWTPFEKNVRFSAPSAFLESPASSVGVVGSLVVQLHGSQRYVLNCTPVRSNGGVSNFYEKDRQTGQRQMMGFSLTQANDG